MPFLLESVVPVGSVESGVVVVSGLGAARRVLDLIRSGVMRDVKLLEIHACPGGCIAGGGQPFGVTPEKIKSRMQALYSIDQSEHLRTAHSNPDVRALLETESAPESAELFHTAYAPRDVIV